MIRTSALAAGLSLVAALTVHGVSAVSLMPQDKIEIEASAGAQETALGSSFEDLAAGTLKAQQLEELTEPLEPEPTPPEQTEPETVEAEPPKETLPKQILQETPQAKTAQPIHTPAVQETPQQAASQMSARALPETNTPQRKPQSIEQAVPAQAQATPVDAQPIPVEAQAALAEVVSAQRAAPRPPETAQPVKAQMLTATPTVTALAPKPIVQATAKPLEVIKPLAQPAEPVTPKAPTPEVTKSAEDAPVTAVTRSARPKRRSKELEAAAATAKPKPKPKKKRAGNSKRNAKKGTASGSRKVKAARKGGSGRKKQSGNAAASNYPGRVMARISAVGRPSVNARGTARVRFSIGSNGGLSSLSIARSSGSRRLDRAAMNMIQRASPFPRPPAGARRSFSINISGR